MVFLTEFTDIARVQLTPKLSPQQKSTLGQFLTPAAIARFLANQFTELSGCVRLLDAGAGVGTLTAAFVERLLANPTGVEKCYLTVYEIEPLFLPHLKKCLLDCCVALRESGIEADYCLVQDSFINVADQLALPLLFKEENLFTHTILNPPYKKISSRSIEKQKLAAIGVDTVNLYSAFVWLASLKLASRGELTAITPRSFCNGVYFKPFRTAFLEQMILDKIHLFESRSSIFSDDSILQENIIFHALKSKEKPDFVEITNITGNDTDSLLESRRSPYEEVVRFDDPELFIHITGDQLKERVRNQMEKLPSTLTDLDLEISTGPVVDFRLRSFLKHHIEQQTVPLVYPESLKTGKIVYPPEKPRKPIGIEHNSETAKWLNRSGWYVLTKRFSSKEEKRRIVAVVCPPFGTSVFGIENHLNYYHAHGKGMDADLARGLATFLNSTLFDNYFRQFSGHTQVNATDLRKIRYPQKNDLLQLGAKIGDSVLDQNQLDKLIQETLSIMSETVDAIQASQRIEEAFAILKDISAPKEQQNERSALCLLALANIQPTTPWSRAQAPRRRITEMMDWFREHYGKQYAPNTRETVRRQTMHQFVQMGLVVENPDNPERPINSPQWCYQLHQQALQLLQMYRSEQWETSRQEYVMSVTNLLQNRKRNLLKIPVTLVNGRAIELSPGGQNQLIKNILENFCPKFTPGGTVLYIGDAGEKFVINESQKLQEMGVELDPHGKMPDLIIYYERQEWVVLVEAVTSHGPINLKRRNELVQLFSATGKGLVFVTAFSSRREMTRYLAEIAWETEVWVADHPDHLIHFDGEKFLGPY